MNGGNYDRRGRARRRATAVLVASLLLLPLPALAQQDAYWTEALSQEIGKYKEFSSGKEVSVKNIIQPLVMALNERGYLTYTGVSDKETKVLTASQAAAISLMAQQMGISHKPGYVSPLEQALLRSGSAEPSLFPTIYLVDYAESTGPGSTEFVRYSFGTVGVGAGCYFEFTVDSVDEQAGLIRGKIEDNAKETTGITVVYKRPARSPQFLAGDRLVAFGTCTAKDGTARSLVLEAHLVAFDMDE